MAAVELLIHLVGKGSALDHSTQSPGDVQDVRPAGFSWGSREAFSSWVAAGNDPAAWPATYGLVSMDLTNPRQYMEKDRIIGVRAGERELTNAEMDALRLAVKTGAMTLDEAKAAARPAGTCGVFRDGSRIATLAFDEIRQIKAADQTIDSIQEFELFDDLDGRPVELDYKIQNVRRRRWAIQANKAERDRLRAGEVVALPASRLYDKRLG